MVCLSVCVNLLKIPWWMRLSLIFLLSLVRFRFINTEKFRYIYRSYLLLFNLFYWIWALRIFSLRINYDCTLISHSYLPGCIYDYRYKTYLIFQFFMKMLNYCCLFLDKTSAGAMRMYLFLFLNFLWLNDFCLVGVNCILFLC